MNLSALSIRRPVMVVLLTAGLLLAGLLAVGKLPVAALPSFNTPVITVSAALPGAAPETMASSVALPLEKQFSTIDGIKLISSVSTLGSSQVTLEFVPSRDIDAAAVDVQAALLRAQRQLPAAMTSLPSYRKVNPADAPVLLMAMRSPSLPMAQLNDYAENLVAPALSTLEGVAQVNVFGQRRFAVRVRINPDALATRNIGLDEVAAALRAANDNAPVGILDGAQQTLSLQANGQLLNAAAWRQVVVASRNGQPVLLQEVAEVLDSYETLRTSGSYNGERAIVLAVQRQPNANTVQVVDSIRALLPSFQAQMPESIEITPVNDRSKSIRESLHDVSLTLAFTVLLVVLVIWLFLKRAVITLIPALTIPISLIGAVALMLPLGYSLDNVSLLAITLAVGLVVDDAIVVLENIHRHIEDGMEPLAAALRGGREMGFTIVSISLSLVAVFIPIFFMPGTIGLLFHEFAVVVGLSVLVSAVVSLTLVPMLASRFLKPHHEERERNPLLRGFENLFEAVSSAYARTLDLALQHRRVVMGVALLSFALTGWLFAALPKGFFPEEDIGQIQVSTEAGEDVSFTRMLALQDRMADLLRGDPNVLVLSSFVGGGNQASAGNTGRMFVVLKPRGERAPMAQVLESLRKRARQVAGIAVYLRPVQNLQLGGRASKARYQFTLQSVSADTLGEWATRLRDKLNADPLFRDVTTDSQNRALQASLDIDAERAALLGVNMADLRSLLYGAFGDRQVSTIYTASGSYQVILEANDASRQGPDALSRMQVRAKTGALVPISAFATVRRTLGPTAVNHQGQLQAVTLSFNLAPGAPLGDATQRIDAATKALKLPASIITSYGGDAAVFQDSQSGQAILLIAALGAIYVLLGVLYESYIHPLTILAGLPSAAVGALISLWLCGMELTLIATIGILMLIGIVKKNAIMMIDFALAAQREQGLEPAAAIRAACVLRFRPIMMTTLAALVGALPIAFGVGAGAELRQPLGVAVVGGLLLSQLITLYITPVIYLALDRWSGRGPLPLPAEA